MISVGSYMIITWLLLDSVIVFVISVGSYNILFN